MTATTFLLLKFFVGSKVKGLMDLGFIFNKDILENCTVYFCCHILAMWRMPTRYLFMRLISRWLIQIFTRVEPYKVVYIIYFLHAGPEHKNLRYKLNNFNLSLIYWRPQKCADDKVFGYTETAGIIRKCRRQLISICDMVGPQGVATNLQFPLPLKHVNILRKPWFPQHSNLYWWPLSRATMF